MKATFKSRDDLIADGFKPDHPYYYKGLKRDADAQLRWHLVENLGGKEVEVIEILDADTGRVRVRHAGRDYQIPVWSLRGTVLFERIKSAPKITVKGKDAKFLGHRFDFHCGMDELETKEAIRVARWILKVTGAKR